MSGETEKQVSGWTVDTLHEHLTSLLAERDRRYESRFVAQEEAVRVALDQTSVRFANVNEWRQTVNDLINSAMPRKESDARWAATMEKIDAVSSRTDRIEARSGGQHSMWLYVISAIGLILTLLSLVNVWMNVSAVVK